MDKANLARLGKINLQWGQVQNMKTWAHLVEPCLHLLLVNPGNGPGQSKPELDLINFLGPPGPVSLAQYRS